MNRIGWHLGAVVLLLVTAGCGSPFEIHEHPISFSPNRHEATLQYILEHYGKQPADISIVPRVIVLHWTAINTYEESFRAFNPETLRGTRPDLGSPDQVNVSVQFLVDRNGSIYRLMPETWMARHVIGLNYSSIGVENVGGRDSVDNLTAAQIDANAALIRYLVEKYPTVQYLIGHYEYRKFEGHSLWLELDATYRTEKVDPGHRFMTAVRSRVSDLGLQGPPRAE